MSYNTVVFPTQISYGSAVGEGFRTHIISMDSGKIEAVARWVRPRRVYDVSKGIQSYADLQEVRDFYSAHLGPAHTFPFKDPLDFNTNPLVTPADYPKDGSASAVVPTNVDVVLGTGDGATTTFQLREFRTAGAFSTVVPISKPMDGTVVVALDGVDQASGWTVNLFTGVITFSSAPTAGVVVTAGCEFYVPVRFSPELDEALMVNLTSFAAGGIPNISLIEDIDGTVVNEDYPFRGGSRKNFSIDLTLTQADGFVFELIPAGPGLSVIIEDAADLHQGGLHYVLYNSQSDTVTLKAGATTVGTIASGETATVVVEWNGSANVVVAYK